MGWPGRPFSDWRISWMTFSVDMATSGGCATNICRFHASKTFQLQQGPKVTGSPVHKRNLPTIGQIDHIIPPDENTPGP
jgi:hypothetical protein